jgi:hypothetical protein
VTFGEGACAKDYLPPESLGVAILPAPVIMGGLVQRLEGKCLFIGVSDRAFSPIRTEILDVLGRRVTVKEWTTGPLDNELRLLMPNRLPNGLYLARHFLQNHGVKTIKFVVVE